VEAFSPKSISSLRALWRTLDFTDYLQEHDHASSGRGFLITLNCPPRSNPNQLSFKRLKDALQKAFLSEFGEDLQGIIWKAERQRNTRTAHLHIVLFLAEEISRQGLYCRMKDTWTRLTKHDEDNFRRFGIKVQTLYGEPGLPKLRKYLEK